MREAIFLSAFIAVVLSSDPRCLRKTLNDSPNLMHESDCRKYYTCQADIATELECPDGLEFNPMLLKCDWPRGFCTPTTHKPVQKVMSCNGLSDGAYYPDFSDHCKSYYYCQNGVAKVSECASGTRFDSVDRKCIAKAEVQCGADPIAVDCKNPNINSTYFINVKDGCKRYTKCQDGEAVENSCEGSLLFNMRTKSCDWPQKVKCEAIAIDGRSDEIHYTDFDSEVCKTKRNGQIVGPNRNSKCASYFICHNGHLDEHYCGDRLVFNAKIGVCDLPENVENCHLKSDMESAIDCSNKHNLRYAHPGDCSAYISCRLGQPHLHKCAREHIFDVSKYACIQDVDNACAKSTSTSDEYLALLAEPTYKKSNTYVNYANGCRSYYDCKKTRCQEKHCLRNFAYNVDKLRCEPDDIIFCDTYMANSTISGRSGIRSRAPSHIDCSVKQGTWFEDTSDSTKFYVCVLGNPILQQCHAGQTFDKVQRMCKSGGTGPNPPVPNPPVATCTEGEKIPDAHNPSGWYLCVCGKLVPQYCASGTIFSPSLKDCTAAAPPAPPVPSPPVPTCTEGQFIPDAFYPTKYYVCIKGYLVSQSCPIGQQFSTSLNICTSTAPPPPLPPPAPPISASCTEGEFIPDAFYLNKYYICTSGYLVSQMCPIGLEFSATLKFCRLPVAPPPPPPPPPPITTNCGLYLQGEFVADPSNPNKYYVCLLGALRPQSCPINMIFNPITRYCEAEILPPPVGMCAMYPEGIHLPLPGPDPGAVQYFIVCISGVFIVQSCPDFMVFDPTKSYCIASSSPPSSSPGCGLFAEDDIWYSPKSNTLYSQCVNGSVQQFACDSGQIFDSTALYCYNPCPTGVTGNVADPNNQGSYIPCPSLTPVICPSSQLFYGAIGSCYSPSTLKALCPAGPVSMNVAVSGWPKVYYSCKDAIMVMCPSGTTFIEVLGVCM